MISSLHKNIYKIVNSQNITVVHSEKEISIFKNSSVNLFVPGQFLILADFVDWINSK